MSACTHRWFMKNIRRGYLVVEGCPECGARSSFFSMEAVAPIDEYHEGKHFWSYLRSFQAAKFDLQCVECGESVDLDDLMGLMLSVCTDKDCEVARIARRSPEGTWVYVALCADSTHPSGRCVSERGVEALNQYFNQHLSASTKTILVVPCKLCNSLDRCRGIVIGDVGLTDMYPDTSQTTRDAVSKE